MLKSVMGILVCVLLQGCTSKDENNLLAIYNQDKHYNKQLQKTENMQLKSDGITMAMLTATYLYDPEDKTADEHFIVGMYAEESETQDFTKEGYSLHLDDSAGNMKKPKVIKPLANDSAYLKNISFVTSWNRFYLVSFGHTDKKSFNLVFKSSHYGSGTLHFAKVAKYSLKNVKK